MKCLQCSSKTSNPKFCSRSCSAKHNNSKFPKRSPEGSCKGCSTSITSSRTYCDTCWPSHITDRRNKKIMSWLSGEWRGGTDRVLSKVVRDYLLKQANYSCSKCGFNTPHPDDGKTILEVNHINGDGLNHSPENLEVICPNCHALTSSYRGRNVGNGRPTYYIRRTI